MEQEKEKKDKKPAVKAAGFEMKLRKAAGFLSVLVGTLLALYIGVWKMIIKPLAKLYVVYRAGQLTILFLIVTVIKCWLSLTVVGLIWSIGYMIKCMLD